MQAVPGSKAKWQFNFVPERETLQKPYIPLEPKAETCSPTSFFLPMELAAVQIADQNESEISAME